MRATTISASPLLAITSLLLPAAASAAPDAERTVLVVDTQFREGASDVVSATGPLSGCHSVLDLESGAEQVGPVRTTFTGVKEIQCGGGSVVVGYEATLNFQADRKTSGTWWVIESTLPGVTSGGGTLKGDAARCEPEPGAEGCILDVFRGSVSG